VLGLRVVVVRSTDVAAVAPGVKRIWLRSDATLSRTLKPGIGRLETPSA
jgi:hypothetical protein